jgi:hypothetical protein
MNNKRSRTDDSPKDRPSKKTKVIWILIVPTTQTSPKKKKSSKILLPSDLGLSDEDLNMSIAEGVKGKMQDEKEKEKHTEKTSLRV